MELANKIVQALEEADYVQAQDWLVQYRLIYGTTGFWHLALSDCFMGLQDYDKIPPLMETAVRNGANPALVSERLGEAFYALEQYEKAAGAFQSALAQHTRSPVHCMMMLGASLLDLGEPQQAKTVFEDLLLETDEETVQVFGAFCDNDLGQYERASRTFRHIQDKTLQARILQYVAVSGTPEQLEELRELYHA